MKNDIFKKNNKFIRKIKNINRQLFSYPSIKYHKIFLNNYWQIRRSSFEKIKPNDFQLERARLLDKFIKNEDNLLLDIGSGDSAQLKAIKNIIPKLKIIGSDKDKFACEIVKKNDFECHYLDGNEKTSDLLKKYSPRYITLFEVIEHMYCPEELIIELLQNKSLLKIFISIPNSGFFTHRLRYLFGRFPKQWIVNPNEHIRFWTLKDLRWWLGYLDIIDECEIIPYKGISILNRIWPNLFAAGLFIIINNK